MTNTNKMTLEEASVQAACDVAYLLGGVSCGDSEVSDTNNMTLEEVSAQAACDVAYMIGGVPCGDSEVSGGVNRAAAPASETLSPVATEPGNPCAHLPKCHVGIYSTAYVELSQHLKCVGEDCECTCKGVGF